MQLHLHPTRCEALTASDTGFMRWSLTTNPATILAQMPTVPESIFLYMYDPRGRRQIYGGVTGSPNGLLFAHQQLTHEPRIAYNPWSTGPGAVVWRRWDDFSLARTSTVSDTDYKIGSLACSPNGRWLVLDGGEGLTILDWQTGEVMSHHATRGYWISGLTFDPTSTFVAGVASHDNWGFLMLWRLDPAARFVPRPPKEDWRTQALVPQDEVHGSVALTLVHESLDLEGIDWPDGGVLADTAGLAAFSPDGQIVIFSLHATYRGCGPELVAFEVPSGRRLWRARSEGDHPEPVTFSPDGRVLLVPAPDGNLLVYQVEGGALMQRLSTGLSEPVQTLAFDHDGTTLWLATEERLVAYQPQN